VIGSASCAGLAALVLLAGCAPHRSLEAASVAARLQDAHRAQVCAAKAEPVTISFAELPTAKPPEGERVVGVKVRGARSVPAGLVLSAMKTRAGAIFDGAVADADLLRVEALSAFSDVRLGWERSGPGVQLTVDVDERPFIGAVYLAPGVRSPEPGLWVSPLAGDLYDPAVVDRALGALTRSWLGRGYLDARAEARALRVDADRVDLCLELDPGPSWVVDRLDPVGMTHVSAEALRGCIDTQDGTFNVAGKPYRADLLRRDLPAMSALLWDRGLLSAKVGPARVTRIRERSALRVEIPVHEGKVYRIGRISFRGRLAGPEQGYLALLPAPGEEFSRARWLEAMEALARHHRALTRQDLEMQVESQLHEGRGIVDFELRLRGP
jgi:outer membrane protein insertion porin family